MKQEIEALAEKYNVCHACQKQGCRNCSEFDKCGNIKSYPNSLRKMIEAEHVSGTSLSIIAKMAFDDGYNAANEWVSVNDMLPEYGVKVIIARPNEYSGKIDILIAQHHKVESGGTTYGHINNLQITYNDYWSLPSVTPFEDITHWLPLPTPPTT